MIEAGMLIAALAIDLIFGEPPAALHPVVWMGRLLTFLERFQPRGAGTQLAYGAMMVATGLVVAGLPAWFLLTYLRQTSPLIYFVVGTFLLKSTFAVDGLFLAVEKVQQPLVGGQLEKARFEMRSLVSRDTSTLSEPLIVAAAVESVGENSSDSFIAPVFFFIIFGVPGALAYRMINTFDSMIGYHGKYEYLGKAAARLDDLVNLIPARLTGLLFVLASAIVGQNPLAAWRTLWRYRRATESPNAGWPMSAMAGALGARLEKADHYCLGDGSSDLAPDAIARACALARGTMFIAALTFACGLLVRNAYFA